MKTLLNKWFIAGCVVWAAVFMSRKFAHPLPPVINGYATDAFAIPVIANILLCFQRVAIIRSNFYTFSVWHIVFLVAYVTLVFEVLLPSFSKTYTGDCVDALLYIAGGTFFYKVMNKPIFEIRG